MKMPTHVEFEDIYGKRKCIMPVEAVLLMQGPTGGWYVEHSRNTDWTACVSPETAARLRRELLGEGEAASEPAAEPEFVGAGWGVMNDSEGLVAGTAERENAEAVQKMHRPRSGRVVPLFIRREDARP